jgi:hypothetical protein
VLTALLVSLTFAVPIPDADGDGLPDAWESSAGLSTFTSDTDAYGLSDYDEVMRCSNPTNSQQRHAYPRCNLLGPDGRSLSLSSRHSAVTGQHCVRLGDKFLCSATWLGLVARQVPQPGENCFGVPWSTTLACTVLPGLGADVFVHRHNPADICQTPGDTIYTPLCTNVSPEIHAGVCTNCGDSSSENTIQLRLQGRHFMVAFSDVPRVEVSGTPCAVMTATEHTIECKVARSAWPVPTAQLRFANAFGESSHTLTLPGPELALASITRLARAGGEELTLTGKRFTWAPLSVTVDGAWCPVLRLTFDKVTCLTPAGSGTQVPVRAQSAWGTSPALRVDYAP